MAGDISFLRGVMHREAASDTSMPSLGEIGLNFFVPYLMNRIAATWNANLAAELQNFNLTTPQMRVLAVLSINSGLTINELSVLTVTEQSTMSRTLDNLETRKLVRRMPRANDMRVRMKKGRYGYPDVVVVCDQPQFADNEFDVLLNPLVVVEVLSKSTRFRDKTEKLKTY